MAGSIHWCNAAVSKHQPAIISGCLNNAAVWQNVCQIICGNNRGENNTLIEMYKEVKRLRQRFGVAERGTCALTRASFSACDTESAILCGHRMKPTL